MKQKFTPGFEWLKKINRTYLVIGGLTGVLLLVIALPVEDTKKNAGQNGKISENVGTSEDIPSEKNAYQRKLEQQLKKILGSVEGVGKVEVMITLKDAGEAVVEKDMTKTKEESAEKDTEGAERENSVINSREETIYIQRDSNGREPFVSREVSPQVEGVLVVAQGGQSAAVVKNISDAVLALFPVEVHKIKVVKMSE